MPQSRGGGWEYAEGEIKRSELLQESRAEDKAGHRPFSSYKLPTWVQHPDFTSGRKFVVEKQAYAGSAMEGSRNYECWNVAHVAAFHDDLKLLSLATKEECGTPNKWGMTPAHMCAMGVHPTGAAVHVLYELCQMGVVDVTAGNYAGQTPWHMCQRMHTAEHLKLFERVLYKGHKPDGYDEKRATQLRLRGKFAREAAGLSLPQAVQRGDTPLPTCITFPGQGSQVVGMLKDLKDLKPVQDMLITAKKVLGYDLLELCLNGPEEKLEDTRYCQPAMFVAGLAALEKLKMDSPEKVLRCQAVAGLSLGEYTALAAAGVFSFETGLQLVKTRAEAMAEQAGKKDVPQAMLSVAGFDADKLNALCRECAGSTRVCQVANYLFPKGYSVAGDKAAIEELHGKVLAGGALQAKMLKTSGAFHTPLMKGARSALLDALASCKEQMQPPRCSVYMNVTAAPIGPQTSVKEIIELLGNQLVSPVLWDKCMAKAIADGCTEFYECGPNKQLSAMMKRINPGIHKAMTNVPA